MEQLEFYEEELELEENLEYISSKGTYFLEWFDLI